MSILTEREAEDFLEKKGFKVVDRILIKHKRNLSQVKIDFPWVMKVSSRHIVHKAEFGGTILNINSLEQAEQAFDKLKEIDNFEGVLVQEFIEGEELIIGLKKTPEFGNVIMLGKGGSSVEKEKDTSFRVLPITTKDAKEMISEIRIYKQLIKNKVNIAEIIKNLVKISNLSREKDILELDINPLMANQNQAIIVDSRIVL